jgi:hypothetical protein
MISMVGTPAPLASLASLPTAFPMPPEDRTQVRPYLQGRSASSLAAALAAGAVTMSPKRPAEPPRALPMLPPAATSTAAATPLPFEQTDPSIFPWASAATDIVEESAATAATWVRSAPPVAPNATDAPTTAGAGLG